jgi:pSer/pThr/pTyr-binding forkhead associated (FHA) protein
VAATAAVSAAEAGELGLAHEPRALLNIRGKRRELEGDRVVLGRSRDCDIPIDDANVSRRHAEIVHEDGGWWVVDLGSTNGVEVNGEQVKRARLEPNDRIVLGRTELVFENTR